MRLMVAIVTDRINEVSQTLIVGLMFVLKVRTVFCINVFVSWRSVVTKGRHGLCLTCEPF